MQKHNLMGKQKQRVELILRRDRVIIQAITAVSMASRMMTEPIIIYCLGSPLYNAHTLVLWVSLRTHEATEDNYLNSNNIAATSRAIIVQAPS